MGLYIKKREINDKSIACFKALLSIVDWKHLLDENSPNNACNEFLRILLVFTMRHFQNNRQKLNEKVLAVLGLLKWINKIIKEETKIV